MWMIFFNIVLYHMLDRLVHETTEGNMWHANHITTYHSFRNTHESEASVHCYMICMPCIFLSWFMYNLIYPVVQYNVKVDDIL